jgi:hypothetical protein
MIDARRRGSFALLAIAAAWACALPGCFGGEPDDKTIARAGLIGLADLPAIAVRADKPFATRSCDPIAVFRAAGGTVAVLPGFDVESTKVEQVVAVFGASSQALAAHAALTRRQRLVCMWSQFRQGVEDRVGEPVTVDVKLSRHALGENPASRVTLTVKSPKGVAENVNLHYAAIGRAVTAVALLARSNQGILLGADLVRKSVHALADQQ